MFVDFVRDDSASFSNSADEFTLTTIPPQVEAGLGGGVSTVDNKSTMTPCNCNKLALTVIPLQAEECCSR